jgi:hypothetical protein
VVLANQGRSSPWALLPQLGTMAYLGTLLGLVPFLVLLFPTGRLLSGRWRPVGWAIGLVLGLYLTALLLTPGPIDLSLSDNPDNPLGLESADRASLWLRPSPDGSSGTSRREARPTTWAY